MKEEKWVPELKTINDIIKFCKENPEYEEFLDKELKIHVDEGFINKRNNWCNSPQVRFSVDHDELILENS